MGVSLNISLTGSQTLVRLDARHPSRGLDVNADLDLVRSPLPPRALRSAARCARAIARERLLGAARFGPSREARSRVFRDGDHGRAAGGARRRVPLSTPLSTLSVRLPRPMRARARTHRSPPARLASSRFGSVLARVFSDPSPLDADAGSPPSLPRPGVQVVRRERERAVHVVAFESPREWPSHLRGGRLRRRRREPGGTPRRLLRVKSTGDRPRVLRPRV